MGSRAGPATDRLVRAGGVLLFIVAAVLLTSIGGAGIVAAPVTLPLMFLVVRRHPTVGFRIAGGVIGALTAAEFGWGLVYFAAGDVAVLGWVVPLMAGAATAAGMATMGRG